MKAAIYNPYMDTLGGGEKYTLSFANVLVDQGYEVDLEWKDKEIISKAEKRFGVGFSKINVVEDIKKGMGYDVCFWLSDGSVPLLRARNNILHFQVPFKNVSGRSLLNKMKLFRINHIVCNSKFTKSVIDSEFNVNSIVIYPPVETKLFKPKRKEDIILYVGRFSSLKQSKRHDILISAFKEFYNKGYKTYQLILAGGIEVGSGEYLESLKKMSKGYPVEFVESPDFNTLKDIYTKARFFWSAAGYGIDENKEPEKVEHFGMTLIEAMASGCIPLVYENGGHREIIGSLNLNLVWNKNYELVNKTVQFVKNGRNKELIKIISENSHIYSMINFRKNVLKLI